MKAKLYGPNNAYLGSVELPGAETYPKLIGVEKDRESAHGTIITESRTFCRREDGSVGIYEELRDTAAATVQDWHVLWNK